MQYWDGEFWLTREGKPHWRQVGDYPAWRGFARELHAGQEIIILRGSRGRQEGQGRERRVRAQLAAETVAKNGGSWRVWVERGEAGVFESAAEKEHQAAQAA